MVDHSKALFSEVVSKGLAAPAGGGGRGVAIIPGNTVCIEAGPITAALHTGSYVWLALAKESKGELESDAENHYVPKKIKKSGEKRNYKLDEVKSE